MLEPGQQALKLSGGQRVAMGRAIGRQPQVSLMAEPLSNLDATLRVPMRAEIAQVQRDLDVVVIDRERRHFFDVETGDAVRG